MATGYKILRENYNDKILSILDSEKECPICRTTGKLQRVKSSGEYNQNIYLCEKCGTEWQGNLYDQTGELQEGAGIGKRFNFKRIYHGVYQEEERSLSISELIASYIIGVNYPMLSLYIGAKYGSSACVIMNIIPIIIAYFIFSKKDAGDKPHLAKFIGNTALIAATLSIVELIFVFIWKSLSMAF